MKWPSRSIGSAANRDEKPLDVYEAVRSRRAVRAFSSEPVAKEVLERVLAAAAHEDRHLERGGVRGAACRGCVPAGPACPRR